MMSPVMIMGVGSGGQGGVAPPWIFKHGTYIVNKGLKVLFFGLFPLSPPWKIFCRRPW